jgi:hypothetical protein
VTGSGTAAEATTQQGRAHSPGNRENKEIVSQDHQLLSDLSWKIRQTGNN